METERVVLAEIYKKDGVIGVYLINQYDVKDYELFGFLKCLVNKLEKEFTEDIT